MSSSNPIKLIKRGAREQSAQAVAVGAAAEASARVNARVMAEVVNEWISECRHARLARYQEMEERFGLLRPTRSDDHDIE